MKNFCFGFFVFLGVAVVEAALPPDHKPIPWAGDYVGRGKVVSDILFVRGFPIGYVEVEILSTYHNSVRANGETVGIIVKVPVHCLPAPEKGTDNWWVTSETTRSAAWLEDGEKKFSYSLVYKLEDLGKFRRRNSTPR